MAVDIQGIVGPRAGLGDGTDAIVRTARTGEVVTSDAHGRYYEAVSRGNVYLASNQATSAVTNLASAATGFILFNPVSSGINLVVLEIAFVQGTAAAAAVNQVMLAANVNPTLGAPTSTTALIVRNALLGNAKAGVGLAYSIATIGAAPVAIRQLWAPSVSATATTGIPPLVVDKTDGMVIVGPGCSISMSAAAALSGLTSMVWEEVAV